MKSGFMLDWRVRRCARPLLLWLTCMQRRSFMPPGGKDWVLVIDGLARNFPVPGSLTRK